MVDFLIHNWGNVSSVAGVIVSAVGLVWAVTAALGARSAARAAQQATVEARDSIGRHLLVVDLQKAVDLIQRLKLLHGIGRWEAALEQYQALRVMISVIIAHYPRREADFPHTLTRAGILIRMMEDYVDSRTAHGLEIDNQTGLNEQLNEIQSNLEDMASAMRLGD